MPEWVAAAYDEYTRRLKTSMRVELEELPQGKDKARAFRAAGELCPRGAGGSVVGLDAEAKWPG